MVHHHAADSPSNFSLDSLRDMLAEDAEPVAISDEEAAAVEDDEIVCWCNNVTAIELREPIREGTAHSLADVQRCTRATGGCGNCLGVVSAVVAHELQVAQADGDRR